MLQEILEGRKDAIVEQWLDCVLDAYPADGSAVFKRRANQFANPVGYTSREGVRTLFSALVHGREDPEDDPAGRTAHLRDILRIRAVQEMPPSEAVGFVLELKALVRTELEASDRDVDPAALRALEARIDRLALDAFDVYVAFREQLAGLKVKEARRHVSWIVDRLNGEATGDDEPVGDAPGSLPIIDDVRVRGGGSP